jgi:hypothetical protein
MADSALIAHVDTGKITRQELALLPTPASTATHQVIPHIEVVNAIIEGLGFRHIAVHRDEYAVSRDGNKMFGLMELDQTFAGCRFALGLRNSHDKSMRLALTVGYRVFVCDNMAFNGDFTPVTMSHNRLPTSGARLYRHAENYSHFRGPNLNALNNGANYFALGRPIWIAQLRLDVI